MTEVEPKSGQDGSAPSWQDYIEALKLEGRRYRPASLRDDFDNRERKSGKTGARDEGQK